MSERPLKTMRLRLRTGDLILRKDVDEFLIGRRYFVLIARMSGTETYPIDNVLSVDQLVNGEYIKVPFCKAGK